MLVHSVVSLNLNNSLQNGLVKMGLQSEIMLRRKPWSLHTVFRNRVTTLNVVNCIGKALR